MKKLILIIGIAFLCSNNGCEKPPFVDKFYVIMVTNNSPNDIRVHLAGKHSSTQYPDTLLPEVKPALQKVSPGKKAYYDSKTTWEENLKELPSDTLSIFIIDNDDYEQKSWQEIRDSYLILKRFDLSIEDLQTTNYNVVYP